MEVGSKTITAEISIIISKDTMVWEDLEIEGMIIL
jgi:hypothetical protein